MKENLLMAKIYSKILKTIKVQDLLIATNIYYCFIKHWSKQKCLLRYYDTKSKLKEIKNTV